MPYLTGYPDSVSQAQMENYVDSKMNTLNSSIESLQDTVSSVQSTANTAKNTADQAKTIADSINTRLPEGNVAVWSRSFSAVKTGHFTANVYAPSGGTWFCFGSLSVYDNKQSSSYTGSFSYRVVAGGGLIVTIQKEGTAGATLTGNIASNNGLAIKIA